MEKQTQIAEVVATETNLEILDLVKKSGVELTKAETYALSFNPYMAKVIEISNEMKTLNFENPTALDSKKARDLRLQLVPNRTTAEKKKDELKANLLTETNLIQSLFNVVKNTSQLTENQLMDLEKHQEKIEAERKAKLKAERETKLSEWCENVNLFPLGDMTDEAFEQLLNGQKLAYEAKIEAERKAEELRLQEIEKQRVITENRNSLLPFSQWIENFNEIDFEKVDLIEMLNLAKQKKSEIEAKQAEIEAENKRLKEEAEFQAKELELERKKAEDERKRIEAENQAKFKAEQEAELKAKKEAEKLAKAPIKKQLNLWVDSFELPPFATETPTANDIFAKFEAFKKWSLEQVNNL
jgi:hypothetical protein